MSIDFKPKSLLAFLTAVSFIALLFGILANHPQISMISGIVFAICFVIWMLFIFLSLARNFKGF